MINVSMEEVVKSKEIINPEMFKVGDLVRFDSIVEVEEPETVEEGEGIGEEDNVINTEVKSEYGIITGINEESVVCTAPSHLVSVGMNPGVMGISYSLEQLKGFSNISILNREEEKVEEPEEELPELPEPGEPEDAPDEM